MNLILAFLFICVGCALWCAVWALIDTTRWQRARDAIGRCACGTWSGLDEGHEFRSGNTWHSRERCQPNRERVR